MHLDEFAGGRSLAVCRFPVALRNALATSLKISDRIAVVASPQPVIDPQLFDWRV